MESLKRKERYGVKTHRPLKKSKSDNPMPSFAHFVENDDPDFPRGGASLLTRNEIEETREESDVELKKKSIHSSKGVLAKNKSKKPISYGEDAAGSLFGDGFNGNLPRFANRITLKNISPKMKLLGVISEVGTKDLVVSLPGGLRGYVREDDALDNVPDAGSDDHESNILSRLFRVGQLVPCVVLNVEDDRKNGKGSKRVCLTLRLSGLYKGFSLETVQEGMVLTAQVTSIEDHGYILDFGVSSFTGFLSKSDQGGLEISKGQLIQGAVKNVDSARAVVHMSCDGDLVSSIVTKDLKSFSIDLLVPGMMVSAHVYSTLENGVLLSFLTYFSGTVDIFHLQNSFPGKTWKDDYKQHKKVNARILFIDPVTRAIGLTLNYHLVHDKPPPIGVKVGDIYENSRIVRVDKGVGLFLEIPSSPNPFPAYVNILEATDSETPKLGKKFKEGKNVRVRVLGFRHLEGLAMCTLKAAAFEGSIFTHSDVKPGMLVKAKVIAVKDFGAIVLFASGVKALCPIPHMSEFEIARPSKKFKVDAELLFRVLGCKSKRITVTYKKTMVKSKLAVLASYVDAVEGAIAHGWISKIEKHGCFVKFYNGVQGFVQRSELGLEPGIEANNMYHVGQVVKCRIINSSPAASKKINLSLVISSKRKSGDGDVKMGRLVSGVVESLKDSGVVVHVNLNGCWKGFIDNEHLADLQVQASQLKSLLKPGFEFDRLLVLENDGKNLVLSAKFSLVNSSEDLPSDIAQVRSSSVIHGYICNIIETGCFVRFLGQFTGFSSKSQALNGKESDLSKAYFTGQSVRSHVLNVNNASGRIRLSLKQSSCFSIDPSFIQGFFLLEDKVARLQLSKDKNLDLKWLEVFSIGNVVEGFIQDNKEFGFIVTFSGYDVVGFISSHQCGSTLEKGTIVRAVVLDISKLDGIVDLSLKPEFMLVSRASNKKGQRADSMNLEQNEVVTAVVEIVKEHYMVLSIPNYNYALGYASTIDYNTQKIGQKKYDLGESVVAMVGALPSSETFGRLLLCLYGGRNGSSGKKSRKRSSYDVGSLVEGEVIAIKPLHLILKFGSGLFGSVHITEVDDEKSLSNPLSKYKIGQQLKARIIMKSQVLQNSRKSDHWELSIRPSLLAGGSDTKSEIGEGNSEYSIGDRVKGYVFKVDKEWVWLTLSRNVMGRMFILDSSRDPSQLYEFHKDYKIGQSMEAWVLGSFGEKKKLLRLTRSHFSLVSSIDSNESEKKEASSSIDASHLCRGHIICGRVKKKYPGVGGLIVQIGPHLYGRVHYTEIVDDWVSDPSVKFELGQFVKCVVLEIDHTLDGTLHVDLSLRSSLQGSQSINENHTELSAKRCENFEDLHPDMTVQGYVKNVSKKGCFIMLSRKIDARILLANLSDFYIENPEKEFPVGMLVRGKISSVDPSTKRVDVTMKKNLNQAPEAVEEAFRNLHVGNIVSGFIKRVEPYGLFIKIGDVDVVGLCHISELSDEPMNNIDSIYRAGEKVTVKILKVDSVKQRIALGMKSSYFSDVVDVDNMSSGTFGNNVGPTNGPSQDIFVVHENGDHALSPVAPSRTASVLPLQVSFDDSEDSSSEIVDAKINADGSNALISKKNDKHQRRKEKEKRELAVSASEERLLQMGAPKTSDDFEKLVRSSPNSSFVWMKYMAFWLSSGDVENARVVAERALRTISMREEGEKLNIWVALFNLENEYGNPPEESLKKTFERALRFSDPKKLHMSLLGVYERTERWNLADELLERMIKKFRTSCKVWLRNVQIALKQGKEGIQLIVNRALSCLPRHKHIKFISHTAIMEFKSGVPDRGRSLFEGVLREYPKRTDIWSMYLDQEIRIGDVEVVRALFERATCLNLHPKKMKFLFKKFLDFEKNYGDEEHAEYVTNKAMEYVENSMV